MSAREVGGRLPGAFSRPRTRLSLVPDAVRLRPDGRRDCALGAADDGAARRPAPASGGGRQRGAGPVPRVGPAHGVHPRGREPAGGGQRGSAAVSGPEVRHRRDGRMRRAAAEDGVREREPRHRAEDRGDDRAEGRSRSQRSRPLRRLCS